MCEEDVEGTEEAGGGIGGGRSVLVRVRGTLAVPFTWLLTLGRRDYPFAHS